MMLHGRVYVNQFDVEENKFYRFMWEVFMKIYVVTRRAFRPDYIKNMVIIAASELEARGYAAINDRREAIDLWTNPLLAECKEIGTANERIAPGVLLVNMGVYHEAIVLAGV
jgi:hypothetical protein